jgi:EAL domain-containing protein (putative c-di-GMP-specific phosphodiesterase class I)
MGVETREQLSLLKRLGCDAAETGSFSDIVDIGASPGLFSENV